MPLLYVAVPLSSVQFAKEAPVFSALREHPAHPGKVLMLGKFSSLHEPKPNPWKLRVDLHEKCQRDEKNFPQPYTGRIENYAIYCLDIPDEAYYQQLKVTMELLLGTNKFTVVGYFRAAAKGHDLQVVLNAQSQVASQEAFLQKLRETNKKITLPEPKLENFPVIVGAKPSLAAVAKQAPVDYAAPSGVPANTSQAAAAHTASSSAVVVSTKQSPAAVNDTILYVAAHFSTLEAMGYYGSPTSLLESPMKPGTVRMIGNISSLAYPDKSLEDLRQKALEKYRQDAITNSICNFLPSPIIYALYIPDQNYLQSLEPTPELYLETDKIKIAGFYTVNEANVLTVLNTDFLITAEGKKAKINFESKLKQSVEQLTKKAPANPTLMSFSIVKARDVVVEEVSVNNGATQRLELTASQELLLKNDNNESSFLQAKYIVPILLLLGGVALCAIGGGLLVSLLWYSFLTSTLIVAGVSTMTGGSLLLGASAATATYFTLNEGSVEPVVTAPKSDLVKDCHVSPTSVGSTLRTNSGKRRSVIFKGSPVAAGTHSRSGSTSGSELRDRYFADIAKRSDFDDSSVMGLGAGQDSEAARSLIK